MILPITLAFSIVSVTAPKSQLITKKITEVHCADVILIIFASFRLENTPRNLSNFGKIMGFKTQPSPINR